MTGGENKRQKVDVDDALELAQQNMETQEKLDRNLKDLQKNFNDIDEKVSKSQKVKVDFEMVSPSEPFFHIVRIMLIQYLDGEQQEELNVSGMADNIVERASIGSVIASSLGKEDPAVDPKCEKLSDAEFDKEVEKRNAVRDIYGFTTILSLSWSQEKIAFL